MRSCAQNLPRIVDRPRLLEASEQVRCRKTDCMAFQVVRHLVVLRRRAWRKRIQHLREPGALRWALTGHIYTLGFPEVSKSLTFASLKTSRSLSSGGPWCIPAPTLGPRSDDAGARGAHWPPLRPAAAVRLVGVP